MNIHRFEAENMRDALAKVKAELGAEAMIISTRTLRKGLVGRAIEVTADLEEETSPRIPKQLKAYVRNDATPGLMEDDMERFMAPLRSELRSLRTLMRAQADSRVNEDIRKELADLRYELAALRDHKEPNLAEIVERYDLVAPTAGRVIALVGPTGVGKTTTIAKLAAQAALVEQKRVGMITLDSYRVGGEQQMQIYADLIGIPLEVVKEPKDLSAVLKRMWSHDIVFIDTAGRSPRDEAAIEALRRALQPVPDLEVHLALSATTGASGIDAINERYRVMRISRLLFTKVDEAEELKQLVCAPARLRLPITYITVGQAVPEDIEQVSPRRLLELATNGFDFCSAAA